MSDTPIADAAAAVVAPAGDHQHRGGTAVLAVPDAAEIAAILGQRAIPIRQWVAALVDAERYEEAEEDDPSLSIVRAILLAETPEAVYGAMNVLSVKELLGDQPGASSNVYEIRGALPLASTYSDGASCFAVISARDLAEGADVTLSCGGRAVQAAILAHVVRGWLPMRARFVRRRKPTRNGYYPINLEAGI